LLERSKIIMEANAEMQIRWVSIDDTHPDAGYSPLWAHTRASLLAIHPLYSCRVPATEVDHRTHRRAGGTDAWRNLQALCRRATAGRQCGWTKDLDGGGGSKKSLAEDFF